MGPIVLNFLGGGARAPHCESVWASISLKDHSKLIVGSFYRPPDKGIEPILNLETELSEITEKLRNNSKYTVMLGGDFNAANIDWDTGIVPGLMLRLYCLCSIM